MVFLSFFHTSSPPASAQVLSLSFLVDMETFHFFPPSSRNYSWFAMLWSLFWLKSSPGSRRQRGVMPLSSPQHAERAEQGRKREPALGNIRLLIFSKNWRSAKAQFDSICYFNKLSYWKVRVRHINLSWDETTKGQEEKGSGRGELGSDVTVLRPKKLFLKPSHFITSRKWFFLFKDSFISRIQNDRSGSHATKSHWKVEREHSAKFKQNFSAHLCKPLVHVTSVPTIPFSQNKVTTVRRILIAAPIQVN